MWHQLFESAAITDFTNRMHFPLTIVAIKLCHYLRVMRTKRREVEASYFLIIVCIDDAAGSIFNLRKILASEAVDRKHQTCHMRWNAPQINNDLLIIAIAIAGAIVASVNHRAVMRLELPKPDGVYLVSLFIKQNAGSIEVDIYRFPPTKPQKSFGFNSVPAQPHDNFREFDASLFIEGDFLTFLQADSHMIYP